MLEQLAMLRSALFVARLLGRAEALGPEAAEARQQAAASPGAAAWRRCMPAACSYATASKEQQRQSAGRQAQTDCAICLCPFDEFVPLPTCMIGRDK